MLDHPARPRRRGHRQRLPRTVRHEPSRSARGIRRPSQHAHGLYFAMFKCIDEIASIIHPEPSPGVTYLLPISIEFIQPTLLYHIKSKLNVIVD